MTGLLSGAVIPQETPDDDLVWEIKGIAAVIKRTPRATYHLVKKGQIQTGKTGGRIFAFRSRLLANLAGSVSGGASQSPARQAPPAPEPETEAKS